MIEGIIQVLLRWNRGEVFVLSVIETRSSSKVSQTLIKTQQQVSACKREIIWHHKELNKQQPWRYDNGATCSGACSTSEKN